jgi:hypothetical protein
MFPEGVAGLWTAFPCTNNEPPERRPAGSCYERRAGSKRFPSRRPTLNLPTLTHKTYKETGRLFHPRKDRF